MVRKLIHISRKHDFLSFFFKRTLPHMWKINKCNSFYFLQFNEGYRLIGQVAMGPWAGVRSLLFPQVMNYIKAHSWTQRGRRRRRSPWTIINSSDPQSPKSFKRESRRWPNSRRNEIVVNNSLAKGLESSTQISLKRLHS